MGSTDRGKGGGLSVRDCRDIDPFDPGYIHLWREQRARQEAAKNPDGVVVLPKLIRSAFHKYGKHAPRVVRLHCLARLHFHNKGHFSLFDMAAVLVEYGYTSYKTREGRRRLKAELAAAPQWFTETKDGFFRFKSWRRIVGLKRTQKTDFIRIKKAELTKAGNAAFVQTLICMQASGQTTATANLCNQTGYKRAAVFRALKGVDRVNVRVSAAGVYTSKDDAIKARRRLYAEGLITTVMESEGTYFLQFTVGNSFGAIKDASSEGKAARKGEQTTKDAPSDSVKVKGKYSTVFIVHEQTPATMKNVTTGRTDRVIQAAFLSEEAETAFFTRHASLKPCRRVA